MKSLLQIVMTIPAALLVVAAAAMSQPSDTITANPQAVRLRRIWSLAGNPAGGGYIGQGCGGIGDLDGDGLSEFAVLAYGKWLVYRGKSPAPDTTAIWHLDSGTSSVPHPVVGDFWGTGHKAIGFSRDTGYVNEHASTTVDVRLRIYRTESGTLESEPSAILQTNTFPCLDAMAADLDGDGADELIVSYSCYSPEVWIYKGGPHFQVDSPTVVLHDPPSTYPSGTYHMMIGDLDGDHHLDLVTSGYYRGDTERVKFYWGSDSSFWRWKTPDRVVEMPAESSPDYYYGFTLYDCDGDGVSDLLVSGYLYRSGGGRDARSRSYSAEDADLRWRRVFYSYSLSGGYLNDTAQRYAMTAVINPDPDRDEGSDLLLFSGGRWGPDHSYVARYRPGYDNYADGRFFAYLSPIGDCNGDGWPDLINSNPAYGFNAGVALILGGGPDIPRDGSLGVEAVAGEGHTDALSTWPNPLGEDLHIAWRGDLGRLPHRFVVHDMAGREIARGEVESWRGEALWHCSGVTPGGYLLSVYDEAGAFITSARLVKR